MSKDEKILYELSNSLDIGIVVVDEHGIVNFINEGALKILGLNRSYILEKSIFNILPRLKMEDILKYNIKYKTDVLKYNGIDLAVIKKTISYNGFINGACVIFQQLEICEDIIRQFDNEFEAALLLKTILETTNDAIVYVNKKGYIEMISKPYVDFLGVNKEEVIGRHVTEVIDNTRLHIVVKTGNSEIGEIQNIKGNNIIANRIPVRANGQVIGAVGRILFRDVDELNTLHNKISKIEKELNLYKDEFEKINKAKYCIDSIISESKSMNDLKEVTKRAAKTNSNVLILGESGTGKELFAHSIHNCSKRANSPFIRVDCGSIPYELIESELFGYEEGAFTGARKGGKIGKFKAADGGTVFLDEIGDLPMNMQVKLLRVLQDKEIERIGSNVPEKVDVRVIAATNKDLEKMVSEGMFRLDLFYRLNVLTINVPPLRERIDDIPILSRYLVQKISKRENIKVVKISENILEYLKRYNWPGNVRELENVLERAIILLDGKTILEPEHLPSKITGIMQEKNIKSLKKTLEETERQTIIDSLIITKGNKTKAADILNISRTSLYEKINKYNIKI